MLPIRAVQWLRGVENDDAVRAAAADERGTSAGGAARVPVAASRGGRRGVCGSVLRRLEPGDSFAQSGKLRIEAQRLGPLGEGRGALAGEEKDVAIASPGGDIARIQCDRLLVVGAGGVELPATGEHLGVEAVRGGALGGGREGATEVIVGLGGVAGFLR